MSYNLFWSSGAVKNKCYLCSCFRKVIIVTTPLWGGRDMSIFMHGKICGQCVGDKFRFTKRYKVMKVKKWAFKNLKLHNKQFLLTMFSILAVLNQVIFMQIETLNCLAVSDVGRKNLHVNELSETFTGSGEFTVHISRLSQRSAFGWKRALQTRFSFSEPVLWVLNYLGQPDGAAERNGYSNVVTHPEVDCMDAAAHMDLLMQGFTLIHRPGEDNERKDSILNSNSTATAAK